MGKFDTHGGRFSPPGYMKVNEGGSHGENPNGGVQIGTDEQGIPNMLEEGEPVYRDFVYSDRIKVDRRLCRKFSIPEKYAGKLYSDVADGILGEAEERPLDPVSRNGLDTMLGRLADMQEEQKARMETRKVDSGMDAMSDDDLAAMEQSIAQGAADEAAQRQAADEAAAADAAAQEAAAQDAAAQQVAGAQEAPADGAQVMKHGGAISRKAKKQAEAVALEVLRRNEADERARYGLRDFEYFERDADGNIVYGADGNPVIITGEQGLTPEDWKFAAAIAGGAGLGNGAVRAAAGRVLDTTGRVYGIADAADKAGKAASGELTVNDLGDIALDAALMVPAVRGAAAYGRTAGNAATLGIKAGNKAESGKNVKNAADLSRLGRARRYIMDPTYSSRFHRGDWGRWRRGLQEGISSSVDLTAAGTAVEKGIGIGKRIGEARTGHGYYSTEGNDNDFYGIDGYGAESDFSLGGKLKGRRANMFAKGSPADGSSETDDDSSSQTGASYTWRPDYGQSTLFAGRPSWWDSLAYRYNAPVTALTSGGAAFGSGLGARDVWRLGAEAAAPPSTAAGKASQALPSGGMATPEYQKARQEIQDSIDYANLLTPLGKPSWRPDGKAIWQSAPKSGSKEAPAGMDGQGSNSQSSGNGLSYPVWPRYAGVVAAGIEGLYNAFQRPDRYDIPHVRPVLPTGSLSLENPEYVPVDESQALAQLSASTAAGLRSARNSGLGPSAGATIAALDSGYGRNAGSLAGQIWDVNAQRRNAVTAQRNANAQQEAQFRYNVDSARAQAINSARLQNIQNDLYRQRLDNAAEGEKYAALRSSIDAISQALAGIGRENFYLNQLNGDSSYDYITGPDGRTYYAPKENTGRV